MRREANNATAHANDKMPDEKKAGPKKASAGSTRFSTRTQDSLYDGDRREPWTLRSSPDTTTSLSAYRPSGLQREDPLAGVVGNARGDLCRIGGSEEAKKAPAANNKETMPPGGQPGERHGRVNSARFAAGLKTHQETQLPARAGASCLLLPQPVQAGIKSLPPSPGPERLIV